MLKQLSEALDGNAKKNLKFPEDFAQLFALEASRPVMEVNCAGSFANDQRKI